jgi:hypothetical protein
VLFERQSSRVAGEAPDFFPFAPAPLNFWLTYAPEAPSMLSLHRCSTVISFASTPATLSSASDAISTVLIMSYSCGRIASIAKIISSFLTVWPTSASSSQGSRTLAAYLDTVSDLSFFRLANSLRSSGILAWLSDFIIA